MVPSQQFRHADLAGDNNVDLDTDEEQAGNMERE
jgi:hypothetical protein